VQDGSNGGGYQTDYRRGKRLQKVARMLMGRRSQCSCSRFYHRTMMLIFGLLAAHTACFIATVVMLGQNQYIHEVGGGGWGVGGWGVGVGK
jgi:hypothetical protein